MVIDFRRIKSPIAPVTINGKDIEMVTSFKFLGTIISNDLSWDANITAIIKKAQQRIFFLRLLRKFKLSAHILASFYRATIESVLTFSITVWYGSATEEQKARLQRVVKNASKIVGAELPALSDIYTQRVVKRGDKITKDTAHPANSLFQLLPSGRRYRFLGASTERSRKGFFPRAMVILTESLTKAKL